MTKLRWFLALAAVACAAVPVAAADHLMTQAQAEARLEAAAAERAADLATLGRLLASPAAERGVGALGQEPRSLRLALATLSDAELDDLASRAEALESDPVAGLSGDVNQLLIIFLIVAIVILVLQAVN